MLIVYEGYEESQQNFPTDDLYSAPQPPIVNHDVDKLKTMEDDSHSGGNCSYDADASNDSIELNLSLHEDSDHTQSSNNPHQIYQSQRQQSQHHHHHHHQNHQQGLPPHTTHSNHLVNSSELKLLNNSSGGNPLASIEITTDEHEYGEKAVRGTTTAPFIPISEETVFLDTDPVTSSGISTMSSPMSCDSWMNYSSNSSDDLSCISDRIHVQQDSSEESSLEFDTSVATAQSTPKIKRNFNSLLLAGNGDNSNQSSDDNSAQPPLFSSSNLQKSKSASTSESSSSNMIVCNSSNNTLSNRNAEHSGQTKRLRGKNSNGGGGGSGGSTTATTTPTGSTKRKALLHRNSSLSGAICDIRMIDFAHTTFVRKNIVDSPLAENTSTTVEHQGPDNGFLRGIESLKRLLNEILNDEQDN